MNGDAMFRSWLAPQLDAFVRLRRAAGATYESGEYVLRRFDGYLIDNAPAPPLVPQTLLGYMAGHDFTNPRSRDNVVGVVWPALEYADRHGAAVEPLPPRPPTAPSGIRIRPPIILSDGQIAALLAGARALPRQDSLRPATMTTLFGLLLCTGLRIGEALALDVGDLAVGEGLLRVRRGKFGKDRVLPLRSSTTAALERYLRSPLRRTGTTPSDPIFVSKLRRRLADPTARIGLQHALDRTDIPSAGRPRLHDMRHTFTVRTVAFWYVSGRDVSELLPALSTYLGHVSVENTRTYLRANALLLEQARRRFEQRAPAVWRAQS